MSHIELATSKQTHVSGGHVNYYLVVIPGRDGQPDTVVEIEDIIEVLQMNFALATTFKSLVRLCKLRHDLGKPGSTAKYESDKVLYYSNRTLAITKRNLLSKTWFGKLCELLRTHPGITLGDTISVPDPKRLEPYTFHISDFIAALNPEGYEGVLLLEVLTIGQMRIMPFSPRRAEAMVAEFLASHAQQLVNDQMTIDTPQD